MIEEKMQELSVNKEFMSRLAKVQDVNGYMELFAEYGANISEEEAQDMYKTVLEAKNEVQDEKLDDELTAEDLDAVNGGFAAITICGLAIPKIIAGAALALIAVCGASAAYKKLKKQYADLFK